MDDELAWFRAMPADQRSWVTLVAQAGIASLVEWCRNPGRPPRLTGEVFGAAPRELVRAVALKQTVDLIRVTVEVLEDHVDSVAEPGDEDALHLAVLQFSREVAFATAHVYASFAENRGAWDARLEALVVDALVRGERSEELSGRAAALGWAAMTPVVVLVGARPPGVEDPHAAVRRAARSMRSEVLVGRARRPARRRPRRAGGPGRGRRAGERRVRRRARWSIGPGRRRARPGRRVGRGRARRAARRAAPGPSAPRPVAADALLAERALAGDPLARAALHERVALPLQAAGGEVLETVRAVLSSGGNLEASARAIFVHPNTVRYRLKRAAELTGLSATDPARQLDPPGGARPRQLDRDRSPLTGPLPRVARELASGEGTGACGPHHETRPSRAPRRQCFVGILQRSPLCFRAAPHRTRHDHHWHGEGVLAVLAPGQGAQKPGMLTDWLELPGAESFFRWAGAIAGADLLTLGTDRRRRGDQGHRGHPAAGGRDEPVRRPRARRAARARGARERRRRHHRAQRRRADRGGAGRRADASRPRSRSTAVRGRAMAAACAQTPTGMSAVLGGDPDEVLAAIEKHGLTPANMNGAGQVVAAGSLDGLDGAQGRPAGQGADHAAVGRRRLPHRRTWPRRARSSRALVGGLQPGRPQPAAAVQRRRRRGDHRRRGAVPAGQPGHQPGALRLLPGHPARPRRHRGRRAAAGRRARRPGQARVEGRRTSRSWPSTAPRTSTAPASSSGAQRVSDPGYDWRLVVAPARGTVSPADARRGQPAPGRHAARRASAAAAPRSMSPPATPGYWPSGSSTTATSSTPVTRSPVSIRRSRNDCPSSCRPGRRAHASWASAPTGRAGGSPTTISPR